MPIRHVYEKVKKVVRDRGETWITLEGSTIIGLPPTAAEQAKHVAPGMKALLDLEDWNPENGLARLWVYDRHHEVMACGMGANGCSIESPVLV